MKWRGIGQGILSRFGWRFQQQSWKWYMYIPGQRQCHTNRKRRSLFECKERTPFFWTSPSITMANRRWCYRCLALTSFDMFRVFGGQVLLPVVYGSRCADEQLSSNWAEHLWYENENRDEIVDVGTWMVLEVLAMYGLLQNADRIVDTWDSTLDSDCWRNHRRANGFFVRAWQQTNARQRIQSGLL